MSYTENNKAAISLEDLAQTAKQKITNLEKRKNTAIQDFFKTISISETVEELNCILMYLMDSKDDTYTPEAKSSKMFVILQLQNMLVEINEAQEVIDSSREQLELLNNVELKKISKNRAA